MNVYKFEMGRVWSGGAFLLMGHFAEAQQAPAFNVLESLFRVGLKPDLPLPIALRNERENLELHIDLVDEATVTLANYCLELSWWDAKTEVMSSITLYVKGRRAKICESFSEIFRCNFDENGFADIPSFADTVSVRLRQVD